MSRHVPRRARWTADGPARYRSMEGLLVLRQKGVWWAEISYQMLAADAQAGESAAWQPHQDRLGPFKRSRNAMVEAERHATLLRNRHGERVQFSLGDPFRKDRGN